MDENLIEDSFLKAKRSAFSLVELMFALVAISVVLAAFAPVITNKFSKENSMLFNSGSLITAEECDLKFPNNFGLECTLCYADEACVTCGGNCPTGMKKNKSKCTCE